MTAETLTDALERAREKAVRNALEEAEGSMTKAAALLGVTRQTLWRSMRDLGIEIEIERRVVPKSEDIPDLVA